MKKISLILFFLLTNLLGNSQNFEWLQHFETMHNAYFKFDNIGNSYTAIPYKDSLNEPIYYFPNSDSLHTHIEKRSPANSLLWSKDFYCTGHLWLTMCFNNLNQAYATINFTGTFSTPDFSVTSNGLTDILLIKISELGDFTIIKHFGGAGEEQGECAFDSRNFLIVTGGYRYSATFDNLVYSGDQSFDFYLLQFDTNGQLNWSERAVTNDTTNYSHCLGSGLRIDNFNNIYVAITGFAQLENNHLDVGMFYGAFLYKFTSAGIYKKEFDVGYSYPYGSQAGYEIDNMGNVYCAYINGRESDFSIIEKIDSLGNIVWQNIYGTGSYGSPSFVITGLQIDNKGNYYYTARGDAIVGITNKLIAKGRTSTGELIWKYYNDITGYFTASIAIDQDDNIYVGSSFRDTLNLGPFNAYSLDSIGFDPFITKISANALSINSRAINDSEITIFPNPSNGIFAIEFGKSIASKICIYDILGKCIFSQQLANSQMQQIDISNMSKGIYFIEVQAGEERANRKVVLN